MLRDGNFGTAFGLRHVGGASHFLGPPSGKGVFEFGLPEICGLLLDFGSVA
jgi:hypothetical protein